jgi:sulfoxide reductase heme-binding subunit YedZ
MDECGKDGKIRVLPCSSASYFFRKKNMAKKTFPWLRIAVHVIGWLPLAKLILDFTANNLTANPIQAIEQRLGRTALYFLVATLAVTPAYTVTGWREILPRRRALGLYAFLYASLHFLTFTGLDYGFNLAQILGLVATKPYILLGSLAFILLLPLAVTSFDSFIRRMKKNWKRLHWLIYPAGLIASVHFAWARKGDLLRLQGNILQPLLWGLLIAFLLVLRIPSIRSWVSGLRQRLMGRERARKYAKKQEGQDPPPMI